MTIDINFVDNIGVYYDSDSFNPLAANYTYMRILNQDAVEVLG